MKNWRRRIQTSLVWFMFIEATRTNLMGDSTRAPIAARRHAQPRHGLGKLRIILFLVN